MATGLRGLSPNGIPGAILSEDFSTLDCLRKLVPSWPWNDFPKPPACVLELVDAIGTMQDLIARFAETGDHTILDRARNTQALMNKADNQLGKSGFYKDRKRTIRKTRKGLRATIDLLNAQMKLLDAAYPPEQKTYRRFPTKTTYDQFAADWDAAKAASLKNAAGTSY